MRHGGFGKIAGRMSPVTGLRARRLHAWLFSYMSGGCALSFIFMPLVMAAADDDRTLLPALNALFAEGLFLVMLPGLFTAIVFLGPVWLAGRIWLSRRGDAAIGAQPATLLPWIGVWVALTAAQYLIAGEENLVPPPGILALLPEPISWFFNASLMAQMGGVTVMALLYRRMRPAEAPPTG